MGKKSGPSPPAPPDPYATANAQFGANTEAAIANATMANIEERGPSGTITYDQIGTRQLGGNPVLDDEGRPMFDEAGNPRLHPTVEVPEFARTTTLNEAEQGIYDAGNAVQRQALDAAGNVIGNLGPTLERPFEMPTSPAQVTNVQAGPLQTSLEYAGPIQQGYQPGGQVRYTPQNAPGAVTDAVAGAGQGVQRTAGGAGEGIQYDTPGAGHGIYAGVPAAGRGIQDSVAGAGAGIQRGVDFSGAPQVTGSGDYSGDRRRVEDAVMARQNEDFARREAMLRQDLANKGLAEGSEAWNAEMQNLERSKVDALNQAILIGGQEQSRLAGLDMAARQQAVGEILQAGGFSNAAQQQAVQQLMASGAFANEAQAQLFVQQQADIAQRNAAQGQAYGQFADAADRNNQAQQQAFQQRGQDTDRNNQAQAQDFAQRVAAGEFGNRVQQQLFEQEQALMEAYNRGVISQEQLNQQRMMALNAAQEQLFGQNMAAATFGNQAQAQQFGQDMTNAGLNNEGRAQAIQEAVLERNQPINELATLFGLGGEVALPQFQGGNSYGIQGGDIQGNTYANYNGALQAWQQQAANRAASMGQIFGLGGQALQLAGLGAFR